MKYLTSGSLESWKSKVLFGIIAKIAFVVCIYGKGSSLEHCMGYGLGEYHQIGVVVKLSNRLDINTIGGFKALLFRHYPQK